MTTFLISGTFWSITLWVLIFIIATYFVTYYLVYLRQTKRWTQSNIPFLQPTFLIGHECALSAAKYYMAIPPDQIYKKSTDKDLIGFFLGILPMIMLRDRRLIRQILVKKSQHTFATGVALPESEVEAQYITNFTASEEKWNFVRTIMTPVFSLNWFQGPRFEKIKETIHELWQNAEKIESDGSPMNVKKVVENAILNIASSNFGIDSHSHAMKNSLRTIIEDFYKPSNWRVLSSLSISVLPFLQIFQCFKFMPRRCCDTMSEILNHQINQRDQRNIETGDLIDIFRSLRTKKESKNSCNKDSDLFSISKGVTMPQMTGMSLMLVLAGTHTVQGTLIFAIHSLSLHPEYQRKVRREVHEAMKKHGVSEFTFEVVRSLSFTFKCLYEASRLYPVPFLMRQCSEDFQISGTNFILRKGDRVVVPLYSMAHDEMQFRDPHSFDPERFDCKESHLAIPGTLLNFGVGPRKCPGYSHGMFVAAAILASLLYKYEIKPRSHLKLMDGTELKPRAFVASPRRTLLVDLVRCENEDEV